MSDSANEIWIPSTLRDYFAAQVLNAFLPQYADHQNPFHIAKLCYAWADWMLIARDALKETGETNG